MHDRKMLKWLPFNSVINSKKLIKDIERQKSRITKPTLSEEQINNLESKILESYFNKIPIEFTLYQSGFLTKVSGTVIKIEKSKQEIILNNYKILHFCEIIQIKYTSFS